MEIKILWLTEHYFPKRGGMAHSCDRIVFHLRQAGTYIHLVHLTANSKHNTDVVVNGKNTTFPLADDLPHALQLLWLEIEKLNFTHIVAFGGYYSLLAAPLFASWKNAKLITLLRGNDFDTGIFDPKKREILLFALQKAHTIGCVSREKVAKVKTLFPDQQVVFTPNGIDLDEWQLLPSEIAQTQKFRTEKLKENTQLIGIFGQLKIKKGFLFFCEALKKANLVPQTHLLIAGDIDSSLLEWLDAQMFDYTHLPFVERLALLPYYVACDAVAIPSFYEGMPNVLLEAGALGVPILAADSGAMPDVLTHHLNGLLFATGNVADCVAVLQDFFSMPTDKKQNLGNALKLHIQTFFGAEQECENFLKIL